MVKFKKVVKLKKKWLNLRIRKIDKIIILI